MEHPPTIPNPVNPKLCAYCQKNKPRLRRCKNNLPSCLPCFYYNFEEEIHETIMKEKLFLPN